MIGEHAQGIFLLVLAAISGIAGLTSRRAGTLAVGLIVAAFAVLIGLAMVTQGRLP